MQVQILATESNERGEKGLFSGEPEKRSTELDMGQLSSAIRNFCEAFSAGLAEIQDQVGGLALKEVEASIELTVKGEVRLIAAASAETKGSIRLLFSR